MLSSNHWTILSVALGLALFFCVKTGTTVSAETPRTDCLTGLYLYNFLLFVDWPVDEYQDRHKMVICLLSKERKSEFLAGIEGKQLRGKEIVIKHARKMDEIEAGCHVLLVRDAEKTVAFDLLAQLRNKPCLTMGDMPGFAELGGMVELLCPSPCDSALPGGTFTQPAARFRINLDAVLSAGFKIRSRILRLSEIVGGIPHGTPTDR